MHHKATVNARARGPPPALGERHLQGDVPPPIQFTSQAWPQLPRADPGPSRVGPFSLPRTGRNLSITTATRGKQT